MLGPATPMSIMVAVGRSAQSGMLIKNAEARERLERVTRFWTTRTGTLTEGKPSVVPSSLQCHSEHPLGAASVRAAESRGLVLGALAGKGVTGPIAGRQILVGNRRMLRGRHRGAEAVPALAAADLGMAMGRGYRCCHKTERRQSCCGRGSNAIKARPALGLTAPR